MMFSFLNNAMVASSQRFLSFELGKGDKLRLQNTFSVTITIHVLLALIILGLAETIGLWFLNAKMNIPEGRMIAANWVYQCSILAFLLNVISVPFNACIIAHEHISVFGYFGILENVLKLGIVFLLFILPFDKLICYSILILALAVLMRMIYGVYCSRHFEECHWKRFKDHQLISQMFNFAGWSFVGNIGTAVREQGVNILLNLFFNVAVNAAKGIANQIGTVIDGFASNFTMALNPQITKRYAIGEIDSMLNLIYKGCKYSLLLMSMMVIPIFFASESLLKLWLGDVAPYTVGFLQLILIRILIECVVAPIRTSLQATGNIRTFQIVISIITISNLPLSWIWLHYGGDPYSVMYVYIVTSFIALVARLMILKGLMKFSYRKFIKEVYLTTIPCIIITSIISYLIYPIFETNIIHLAIYGFLTVVIFCILSFYMAFNKTERRTIISYFKTKNIIK